MKVWMINWVAYILFSLPVPIPWQNCMKPFRGSEIFLFVKKWFPSVVRNEFRKVNWFHPELTRERSHWFLFFEIKRVFVYNSTVFKLTDLFVLYFFIQNVYANKKYVR